MNKVIHKFRDMPVALTGLALGVAGISGALSTFLGQIPIFIGDFISFILVTIIFIKDCLHFDQLKNEISHPTLGSFIPTFDMTLMTLAGFIANYNLFIGRSLWIVSIIIHIIFCFSFFYYRIKNFEIHHVIPSWFVPPVGIVVACVSGANMNFPQITHIIFYIGFILYLIMLPIMMYRIIFVEHLDDGRLPTFAIMAAPPSLCLAGYLTSFSNPSEVIIYILLPLAVFMTMLVYVSFFRILRISFNPSYASFTFPLAIGATAFLKYSNYLVSIESDYYLLWKYIGITLSISASIIITIIFIKMILYIKKFIITA